MKAVVKGMWIDSASESIEQYVPSDPRCFGVWIEIKVGPDTEDGSHDYRLLVCTPDWVKQECHSTGFVWGRHMLIVLEFDFKLIELSVRSYVESCSGDDFYEIAQKVARFAAWEFEDYEY